MNGTAMHQPQTDSLAETTAGLGAGSALTRLFPFVERTVSSAGAFRDAGTHLAALERAASGAAPWSERRLAVQGYLSSSSALSVPLYPVSAAVPVSLPAMVTSGNAVQQGTGGSPFLGLLYDACPGLRAGAMATLSEGEFRCALSHAARETRRRTANAATLAAAASIVVEGKALYDLVIELQESKKGWELEELQINALVKDTIDIDDYLGILQGHLHSLEVSSHMGHSVACPSQDELDTLEELTIDLQYRLRDITRRIDDTTLTVHDRHVSLRQIRSSLQANAMVNSVYAGVRGLELFYMSRSMSGWAVVLQSISFVGHALAGAMAVSRAFDAKESMDRIVGHLETLGETRSQVAQIEDDFYQCQRSIRPYLRGAI